MKTEEFIRSRAKMNWSRKMVADALGVNYQKFLAMARLMPDVKWCASTLSVDWQRSKKARKGVSTAALAYSCKRAREVRMGAMPRHNIAGFVGTVREIYDAWRDLISVSLCQVRRPLRKGVNVLDAFFKPSETHLGWGQNGKFWQ